MQILNHARDYVYITTPYLILDNEMLSALSGREHTVYTGVTVCRGGQILTQHEATAVRFRPLTAQEIDAYIATGEPMDKAGLRTASRARGCSAGGGHLRRLF